MTGKTSQTIQQDGEALVRIYTSSRTQAAKDDAIRAFLPLVKYIVGRTNIDQFGSLQKEDLYQFGIVGLLMALDRYETDKGANFKTFAYRRVYGEVIDAIRRESSVSKDAYSKRKRIVDTSDKLSQTLGRDPAPVEVADAMGITQEQLEHTIIMGENSEFLSLDEKTGGEDSEFLSRQEVLADKNQLSPEKLMSKAVLKKELFRLIKALPEKTRLILALYYYEELTLNDIGSILGLSESRISQIITKTLEEMRSDLKLLIE